MLVVEKKVVPAEVGNYGWLEREKGAHHVAKTDRAGLHGDETDAFLLGDGEWKKINVAVTPC